MTKIGEDRLKVSIRSEGSKELQELRNAIAVLISKRNRALAKLGESAMPELKENPDYKGQVEEIEGYIEEISELEEKERALMQ